MQDSHADITLLFITSGETPLKWREHHRKMLPELPMITVSRKPGGDLLDTERKSYENIYRQMLRAAKIATTPYVAMVEDDVLYSTDHFTTFRPPMDTFSYNQNRWALFTWGVPTYSWRNRVSNCTLIAPRELLIEALEERFTKYPNGLPPEFAGELGRERVEKGLGVTRRKMIEWYSKQSVVQFNHTGASEDRQKRMRKSLGPIQAFDVPYWGNADELVKLYQ